MKRKLKAVIGLILLVVVIIQFIANKLPENKPLNSNSDIIASGLATGEIARILKNSCYDCHSNQVKYPWYSYVAPVSWLVINDVEEGRKELNFSEWSEYPKRRMLRKMEDVGEQMEKKEMPLPIYTFIHRSASLSENDRTLIKDWAKNLSSKILNE